MAKFQTHFYYPTKDNAIPNKWHLLRLLAKERISITAQLKLEWIIFYHTISEMNAAQTARHFGICRKTFYKWFNRFNEKNLLTLEEKSRAPEKTRQREISLAQREKIRILRKKHLRWGKMKLQRRYLKEYGEYISSWKIQKVIEQEHLYFDKVKQQRQAKRQKQAQIHPKKRITELVKEDRVNHLWHVDTVVFTLIQGGYRFLLTAIDEVSKLAYARLYTTHSSRKAADFLKRLHYLTEGEMINLHHDNGSEFEKDFKKACLELSLPQWYSRVRTPTDNPVLERFNRTIQEEFVEMIDIGLEDVDLFNQKLLDWLIEYNSVRPHETLDYLTPLEYIEKRELLPMSSSCTHS
jgi:transposase InsO family protein